MRGSPINRTAEQGAMGHLLAALAYGAMAHGCLGVLLVSRYHGRREPSGEWIRYVDVFGSRWSAETAFASLFAVCICVPLLLALILSAVRPIRALESRSAIIGHSLAFGAAILVNLVALFFGLFAGWNSESF